VVAYELVTGARPFVGTSVDELLRTIDELPKVGLRAADVPPGFCEVIARSLARDRKLRQQSASELVAGLRGALQTAPVAATTASQRDTPTGPLDAKPAGARPSVAVLVLLALVVALGGWLAWRSTGGATEPATAVAPPPPVPAAQPAQPVPTASGLPVLRYYFEVSGRADGSSRATGSAPLGRDQRVRLHLIPLGAGYLQVLAKTRVLLRETRVAANADVVFPASGWLPPEELVYTIVFSREPDALPKDGVPPEPRDASDAPPSREVERPSEMEVVDESVSIVPDEKTGIVTVNGPSDGLVMFDIAVKR
jgi:hypothetical protein